MYGSTFSIYERLLIGAFNVFFSNLIGRTTWLESFTISYGGGQKPPTGLQSRIGGLLEDTHITVGGLREAIKSLGFL